MREYIIVLLLPFAAFCNAVEIYADNDERGLFGFHGMIEDTINSTLNKIRHNLTDPIIISPMPFDFGEGEALSGGLNFSYINIGGVKDFVATYIDVHILSKSLELHIVLKEITVLMKYWADMVIMNLVPVYGKGKMVISFDEIKVKIRGSLEGKKIKDIVLFVTLQEATFDLNGLLNNSEYSSIVSNALTDNFANFLNVHAQMVSDVISPIIETIINSHLDSNAWMVRVKGVDIRLK